MAVRQLVVPGTGGCTFKDATGTNIGGLLELRTVAPEKADLLRCRYPDDATRIDTVAGGDGGLEPAGFQTAAYEVFKAALGWRFFNYDWRLDIRHNGALLAEELRKPGPKWHIVSHSQGGLVVLEAARLLKDTGMQQVVDMLVFVGVPFLGTFSSVTALLSGAGWGTMPAPVVRTWPAVYQMLPAWPVAGENLRTETPWVLAGLLPPVGQPTDPEKHLSRDGLRRASAWHALKGDQLQALRLVRCVRVINGSDRPTTFDYPQFPLGAGAKTVDGDTAVPSEETHKRLPDWMRQPAAQGGADYQPLAGCAEHFLMCNDEQRVMPWCRP